MNNHSNTQVGIIIPTMNRADFVIRLLDYYADLKSQHIIYLGDSSTPKEAERIRKRVSEIKGRLNVVYNHYPPGDSFECMVQLATLVKEKYICQIGDDDYWVPDTLTRCAEFLDKNRGYASTIGYSLTFKIKGNGAYGELKEIHDYPRHSIEEETAAQRLFNFLGPSYAPMISCITRTESLLNFYKESYLIKDMGLKGEILPSSLIIIAGKLKVIEKIGFVRQIHESHFKLPDFFDWLTSEDWHQSYGQFRQKIIQELKNKDGLNQEEAEASFKGAFWNFLRFLSSRLYPTNVQENESTKLCRSLRFVVANNFPFLKRIYRKIRPILGGKLQLHYEVMQPSSPYYSDFAPILKSLSPKQNCDTFDT